MLKKPTRLSLTICLTLIFSQRNTASVTVTTSAQTPFLVQLAVNEANEGKNKNSTLLASSLSLMAQGMSPAKAASMYLAVAIVANNLNHHNTANLCLIKALDLALSTKDPILLNSIQAGAQKLGNSDIANQCKKALDLANFTSNLNNITTNAKGTAQTVKEFTQNAIDELLN